MAKFKYIGEANRIHLKDDKKKRPLEKGDIVDITVKRAEEANKKFGEVFERVVDEE